MRNLKCPVPDLQIIQPFGLSDQLFFCVYSGPTYFVEHWCEDRPDIFQHFALSFCRGVDTVVLHQLRLLRNAIDQEGN